MRSFKVLFRPCRTLLLLPLSQVPVGERGQGIRGPTLPDLGSLMQRLKTTRMVDQHHALDHVQLQLQLHQPLRAIDKKRQPKRGGLGSMPLLPLRGRVLPGGDLRRLILKMRRTTTRSKREKQRRGLGEEEALQICNIPDERLANYCRASFATLSADST